LICAMLVFTPLSWTSPIKPHTRCLTTFICSGYEYGCVLATLPPLSSTKLLGIHLEIWVTPGQQMMVKCSDWGCRPNQDWSHINVRHMQVFDNLHMLWMWIWMCPYNNTAALIDQALGSHLEIWVTPGQQMMVKCSDWGCRPNQNWSHINVRHMQGVWQPSYAVDVHMDASQQHSSSPCWLRYGKSPRNLGNSWATNDGEVRWLRL
jgi:phage-related protein